jgi:hypothetical protein
VHIPLNLIKPEHSLSKHSSTGENPVVSSILAVLAELAQKARKECHVPYIMYIGFPTSATGVIA